MEKGAGARTLSSQIFKNCGNFLDYLENISLERKGVIEEKKSGHKIFCEIQGCANCSEGY